MSQIHYEDYQKQEALSLAIDFLKGREGYYPENVIEVAQEFLNWINGVEVQ